MSVRSVWGVLEKGWECLGSVESVNGVLGECICFPKKVHFFCELTC